MLPHRYFADPRDIAFSFCIDSYLLFKNRGGPSGTPLLIKNINLDPSIRTHLKNLLCVGVIPGPHLAKDLGSFLTPFEEECVLLAKGVRTYDALAGANFDLHAYHLCQLGDIISIEKFLGLKGHNSIHPCRSCPITATRDTSLSRSPYYAALAKPAEQNGRVVKRNPAALGRRLHESWGETAERIRFAHTAKERNQIAKDTGIKEKPAMSRVSSLNFAVSIPWDWMHLMENIVSALISLWKGTFKGLDTGVEDYVMADSVWQVIGEETESASSTIPSPFTRKLPNIWTNYREYNTEAKIFWFMYLAPILLKGRLEPKFYDHACVLVKIMQTTTQWTISLQEITGELTQDIYNWVEAYEE